ncbi:uncharacterized protein ARMOST_02821 [Armillaria ostoyae]|uniref:Heat shock factor-binding protein 1 n=1 Tax=Armillaria ostoyae TaxID=47428 RepID=A0A284QSR1_ARMOS|nr:uncharacterized protein ARMOST_02821 [Armillaria ostoyae]
MPPSNSDGYIAGAESAVSMSDVPAAAACIPQFEPPRPPFSMASSALPLKVNPPATPKATPKAQEKERDVAPAPVNPKPSVGAVKDISSPHELTAFVETLLENLDAKFDEMSTQILDRMSQMSTRVDALEASIQDIINGDVSVPQSPSPGPGVRRSDSGI